MKTRFLVNGLLLSLVVHSSLLFSQIPQGYKKIECTIVPIDRSTVHGSHPRVPGPRSSDAAKAAKNQETSTNWGGYVAATSLSSPAQNSVSEVFGSWVVPSIKPSINDSYCAIWAGIDGYTSPTVEQIGTSHNYINGVVQHYAWFEMYPRPAYMIKGFPVRPGDIISVSVQYTGGSTFTLTIYNNNRRVGYTVPTSYTKAKKTQRSSAEWIVEAPWLNRILPLANFGTASLLNCMATINGVTALLNTNAWPNTSMEMVTRGGETKALPSSPVGSNGNFSMMWKHE